MTSFCVGVHMCIIHAFMLLSHDKYVAQILLNAELIQWYNNSLSIHNWKISPFNFLENILETF